MIKQGIVIRRLISFIIDMFIVSMIVSMVLFNRDMNSTDSKRLVKLVNDYTNEKITTEVYINKYANIIYEANQENFDVNLVYFVVSVGYFLIFQYLNNGASIGKRLMKIRIVKDNRKNVSFMQLLVRVCMVNEIFSMGVLLIVTKLSHGINFLVQYGFISFIGNLVLIICGITLLIRKDGKALHDIVSKSQVIEM